MRILDSKIVVGLVSFALGVGAVLLAQRLEFKPKLNPSTLPQTTAPAAQARQESIPDSSSEDDFFEQSRKSFEAMRKMQEQMMKQFEEPQAGFGFFQLGSTAEIKRREDKDFVYYDIGVKDLSKDKLKVRVADGQISISGQIEKKFDDTGNGAYFSSSFHRSFPIPDDVDGNKVQLVQGKDLLTLKFPKLEHS